MSDFNERKVQRGDALKLPASTWNAVIDSIKFNKQGRLRAGAGTPTDELRPNTTILIRNDVGTLSDSFRVFRIGDALLTLETDLENGMRRPAMAGLTPDSSACPIAIVQTPAPFGEISTGVVSGITLAFIEFADFAHTWANPVDTKTDRLLSVECNGQARILFYTDAPPGYPEDVYLAVINLIGNVACNTANQVVEITSTYPDAILGYSWKYKSFDNGIQEWIDTVPAVTGNMLFEVNDNYTLTQGTRVVMFPKDGIWACEVQEEFPAELTTLYGGALGYGWKELKLTAPTFSVVNATFLAGLYAFDVSDNQDLQIGDRVWLRKNGNGWVIDRGHIRVDCGLAYDPILDTYYVDPGAFAGDGLVAVYPEGDCPYLDIDYGCGLNIDATKLVVDFTDVVIAPLFWDTCTIGINYGCGLALDGDDLVVDLTDVVFDGLYFDNTICALGVDYGCGLTLFGPQLMVNNVDIADDPAVTALVPVGVCALGVDLDVVTNESYAVDRIKSFGTVAGQLCLKFERRTVTNYFNVAGLHIDTTVSAPAQLQLCYDICAETCCDATPLLVSCGKSGSGGAAPYIVYFTATPSGGISACPDGYTYLWDFGDGYFSSLQNPSHTYTECGLFVVTVAVTDCCGTVTECSPGSINIFGGCNLEYAPYAGYMYLVGYAPIFVDTGSPYFDPPYAALTLTGYAPTMFASVNQEYFPSAAMLTLNGYAPTVFASGNVEFLPPYAPLALVGYAPTVFASDNVEYLPSAAMMTLNGYAPSAVNSGTYELSPANGLLTLTGYAPSAVNSGSPELTPTYGTLTMTGYAPTINNGLPGTSCTTARTMAASETYTATSDGTNDQWFKYSKPSGHTTLDITITGLGKPFNNPVVYKGACGAETFYAVFLAYGTANLTPPSAAEDFWVKMIGPVSSGDYSVQFVSA